MSGTYGINILYEEISRTYSGFSVAACVLPYKRSSKLLHPTVYIYRACDRGEAGGAARARGGWRAARLALRGARPAAPLRPQRLQVELGVAVAHLVPDEGAQLLLGRRGLLEVHLDVWHL